MMTNRILSTQQMHYHYNKSSPYLTEFDNWEAKDKRSINTYEPQIVATSMDQIIEPHENDVLLGRGGKNNQHIGNEKLRQFAREEAPSYAQASKSEKTRLSNGLVQKMKALTPPARFLRKNGFGYWEDVSDDFAREKTSQVLRDAVNERQKAGEFDSRPEAVSSVARVPSYGSSEPTPNVVSFGASTQLRRQPRKRSRTSFESDAIGSDILHRRIPRGSPYSPLRSTGSAVSAVHPPQLSFVSSMAPSLPTRPYTSSSLSTHFHPSVEDQQVRLSSRRPSSLAIRQGSTASHQSLLGDVQEDTNEFDLFDGELLEEEDE